jgi:hypothetical protein
LTPPEEKKPSEAQRIINDFSQHTPNSKYASQDKEETPTMHLAISARSY